MSSRSRFHPAPLAVAAALLLGALPAQAQSGAAAPAASVPVDIRIPAQPLSQALDALALVLVRASLLARADAVLWTSLLGFALYAVAALWVFSARSATRAWAGLGAVCAPCAALLWLWPL